MTARATAAVNSPLPAPAERRLLRESAALTREDLATALGVRPRTVSAWESGHSTPRGRVRAAYAQLLAGWEAARHPADDASPPPGAREPGPEPARRTTDDTAPHPDAGPGAREPEPEHERAPEPAPEPGPEQPVRPAPAHSPDPGPDPDPDGVPAAEPEPDHAREPDPVRSPGPGALTPAGAFELLHAHAAPALVHQVYLLTGRPALAAAAVERAFHTAWERWPEVARDPDPEGWVRAAAYEYALSPWHRLRPLHARQDRRHGRGPDAVSALLRAVVSLPPSYRRTLLLVDLVGLGLPEAAAETEASTPAAAGRLTYARRSLATALPDLEDPAELRTRLTAVPLPDSLAAAPGALSVRSRGEHRTLLRTRGALALTALIATATAFTLATAPSSYERPHGPAHPIAGAAAEPGRQGPQSLSWAEEEMRAYLRGHWNGGSGNLSPAGV